MNQRVSVIMADELDGGLVIGENSEGRGSRKRIKNETRREKAKLLRYACHLPNLEEFQKPCNHNDKGAYSCGVIQNNDIILARQKFYGTSVKSQQDMKISHLLLVKVPRRHRRESVMRRPHGIEVQYRVWSGEKIKFVCKKFFLELFGISYKRVLNIAKKKINGNHLEESRGGDRKSKKNEGKREKVKEFIGSLRGCESHYGREKSRRLYLPCNFSIRRLWKMYNMKTDDIHKVKYGFFSKIFNNCFNIGFGSAATDICSFCCRLKNSIKSAENANAKQQSITDLRIHKLRAKQFSLMMKENSTDLNTAYFCFDMQQVQPLPKVAISEAFYSHQISYYTLCIVEVKNGKSCFYSWTEDQANRGANEVGSALIDYLRKYDFPENCGSIRFFADGCGGQNKNCHIIHILSLWLQTEAPVHLNRITLIFPVRGHSYLPADRVFGQIEKKLRKESVILHKEDYFQIYAQHGEIRKLSEDWRIYNVKDLLPVMKKMDGILGMKRIFLHRTGQSREKYIVKFKMDQCYRNEDLSKNYESVLRRGKTLAGFSLQHIPPKQAIKEKKIKSLKSLLQAYDSNWMMAKEYSWYQEILCPVEHEGIHTNVAVDDDGQHDEYETPCDCTDEENAFLV